MDDKKIQRINFLAKKSRAEGLTDDELREQKNLREEYVAAFRNNLTSQLDNTYIVGPDGKKRKLNKKK